MVYHMLYGGHCSSFFESYSVISPCDLPFVGGIPLPSLVPENGAYLFLIGILDHSFYMPRQIDRFSPKVLNA